MAIMLGDGTASAKTSDYIKRTVLTRVAGSSTSGYIEYFTCDVYDSTAGGAVRKKVDMTTTASNDTPQAGMINFATFINAGAAISAITYEDGTEASDATPSTGWTFADVKTAVQTHGGEKVFITYSQPVKKSEIVVSGDTFPGTYYVTGDTYARSDVDGSDSFFQFIIPKAKMSAENTITLEAEGDPSTFNMNLTVLRPESGEMMKLVQYDLEGANG